MKKILLAAGLMALVAQVQAGIIAFDLRGTAGNGLLAGNEPSLTTPSTASGGEIGAGILYDDILNLLTLNIGWGSSQGFTDLTSAANNSHIHGPTASNNGNGFTQTAGVLINLARSSNLASGGTFTTPPITITEAQEADLLNGKWYVNIHTANNGGGEIRGFLVQAVPEPSVVVLGALGAGALLLRLRRRK